MSGVRDVRAAWSKHEDLEAPSRVADYGPLDTRRSVVHPVSSTPSAVFPTATRASGLGLGLPEQEVWTDDYAPPDGTALRLPKNFWSISSPFRRAAMDDARARDLVAT